MDNQPPKDSNNSDKFDPLIFLTTKLSSNENAISQLVESVKKNPVSYYSLLRSGKFYIQI